jgi:hypothetical protein
MGEDAAKRAAGGLLWWGVVVGKLWLVMFSHICCKVVVAMWGMDLSCSFVGWI